MRTLDAPIVCNPNAETRNKESGLTSASNQFIRGEVSVLDENLRVDPVSNTRAGNTLSNLADFAED